MDPHILFVDDADSDVQLMIRRLQADGVQVKAHRVYDEASLRQAVEGQRWDVALVDYQLPGFGGLEAIHVLAAVVPETPVITVSGTIDEDTAVATLRAGAVDYVLKDNLVRLAPAVRRAIAGARVRRDLQRRAEQVRTSQFVLDHSSLPVAMMREDGTIAYANEAMSTLSGLPPERLMGAKLWDLDGTITREEWGTIWDQVRAGGSLELSRALTGADGTPRTFDIAMNYFEREGGPVVVAYVRDVTNARLAEEALRESEQRFAAFGRHLPGYLFMVDEEARYIFSNERTLQEGDIPPEDWIGHTPEELWPADEARVEMDAIRRALGGEVVDFVATWQTSTRTEHLHSLLFPIHREGRPPLVGGLAIDVGALVAAETELRHTADELRDTAERLQLTVEGAVLAMGQVVETRDPYTAGHERRVVGLAVAIAAELELPDEVIEGLRIAAAVHDIGKIAVPAEILTRPGSLSPAEFRLIVQHPESGRDILADIHFERPVADIVLQHHERLDGSGYPAALRGEEILLEARILAVADVVEAMSSHRPYRPALGLDAALAEVEQGAGGRYDADVVAACVRVFRERGFTFGA